MRYEEYFPLGIAYEPSFLGREAEMLLLKNNVNSARHTLLISPRKYGKSSLVKNVISKLGYPAADIDFFLAANAKSIESKIIKGVRSLIKQITPSPEAWIKTLADYFKRADKQWTIGIKGASLELIPDAYADTADNILDALRLIEHLLAKKKQKAILFIDEVQEIARIENHETIEGAIRHFAQEAKYLTLIFSGSNRNLLEHMFKSSHRPLYDLCETIKLERLDAHTYKTYLNKVANKTLGKPLDDATFNAIMHYSERHPKVVYLLCKQLWDYCTIKKKLLNERIVQVVWNEMIEQRLKDTRNLLSSRNNTQIKLLTLIATGHNTTLSSKAIQIHLNITSGAVIQALAGLEQLDLIQRLPDKTYQIIDPIIKSTLAIYNKDYIYETV